jgi:peptidoglycan hydrolase-like protein with peptidoglycan-binding domain
VSSSVHSRHSDRPGHPARRLGTITLAALGLAGLVTGIVAADVGAAPTADAAMSGPVRTLATAVPITPSGLPSGLEPLAAYVPQVSCDPTAKAGVLKLAHLLTATYPGTGYVVTHPCGEDAIADEHADGRALDWQVSARDDTEKAQAQAFLSWLFATDHDGRPFAMARRLGIMYVIWDDNIWGAYDALTGWRPYSTCAQHPEQASDVVCHRDRLHISLSWAGAQATTSFWDKTVASEDYGPCRPADLNWAPAYTSRRSTACPDYPDVTAPARASATAVQLVRYSGATIQPGDTGPAVSAVQKGLGVVADGDYGPYTADAVVALQRRHGLVASGAMDADTWRALLAEAMPPTTAPSPVPTKTGVSLTKYLGTVLRYGARGPAVLALQRRLGITTSGWFGPLTRAKVVAFQVSVRLRGTGVVDRATWKALGA